ncbi:MAG: prephenate dehydrogenase/arogenate dehydrogenase family protein [Candidatus Bathyarchaeota archaeon]|nr:prephenate dehydrogenase/arogenate dehydrogenase family protein [Candidatus Bathyarchaeota archaeon]
MKIAVIGAGKMGVWFAKFFQSKGHTVILADRKAEKLAELKKELNVEVTNDFKVAVQGVDQVLLCVSINAIEEVAKTISPALREGQVVMDIASIKEAPVKAMHQYIKGATVLGTHPVFGPGSNGVKHKAYILTPINPKEQEVAEQFKQWLEQEEAHVFIMTPQKHDQLMSVVLGLPHFVGLVACETLLEQKNLAETKEVTGTTYRMLFTLAEATALETPDLYASLQTNLPELGKVEDLFMAKAQEWLSLIKNKDAEAIVARMEQLKKRLMESDRDFDKSYDVMYKMLESIEK